MKKITLSLALIASMAMMISCGDTAKDDATKDDANIEQAAPAEEIPVAEEAPVAEETAALDLTAGKALYEAKCQACHQANGEGLAGAFPTLAKSDYLADKTAAINTTIKGLSGEVTVNGTTFNSAMPPVAMSDQEIVDVMNYVYNSWGNEGTITLNDIAAAKK